MAQKKEGGVASAENYTTNFRKQFRRDGKPPNAADTGASGPSSAEKPYKGGGKVKPSTPQPF